jgi:hypothetical protein
LVEHRLETLLAQRIFGLALGYEDLNDHDELRKDPVLAVLAGKLKANRENCEPVAGKSTLNRLERIPKRHGGKYHKIDFHQDKADELLMNMFLEAHDRSPGSIILDLDATDIPLFGNQEGRHFHAHYNNYVYLPLYVFCGRHLLLVRHRRANVDAASGSVEEVERMVTRIRKAWPRVKITLRADSGYARDELMTWCEANKVDFIFGLARNKRLEKMLAGEMAEAKTLCEKSGQPTRVFKDFRYQTLDSWSKERRVVGKAEHTVLGSNPRFVVTTFNNAAWKARELYEELYCARGEAENRIGEQFELFADRASCETEDGNRLRMMFSAMAYVLMDTLRRVALRHTVLANAAVNTIRLKLLKIGALVRISVRRIHFAMASRTPNQMEFEMAHVYLRLAFGSG